QEKVEGRKVRKRSDSFKDHFSQATMFWNSMSDAEQQHITEAFSFELGKCDSIDTRQQVVDMYANVNLKLAQEIAANIGVKAPQNG
ncbi:catalase-related domain-containing protein, partial [Peribacillus sp. SIMBA_075]|uniref:catalase-related domain-containing protein n=1 Tax=Peribacillus sp. SIMBA_075 TaxID=3085813 RepID=UPI00397A2B52